MTSTEDGPLGNNPGADDDDPDPNEPDGYKPDEHTPDETIDTLEHDDVSDEPQDTDETAADDNGNE